VLRLSALFRIELFAETAHELGFVTDRRKHAAEKKKVPGLHGLNISAEWSGCGRKFNAELLQPALRADRLRALRTYHLPECAPPSTCNTSPVT
jgi:hypothetical protein